MFLVFYWVQQFELKFNKLNVTQFSVTEKPNEFYKNVIACQNCKCEKVKFMCFSVRRTNFTKG